MSSPGSAPTSRATGPTSTRKTYAVLADQLRDRILSGELAEGERLPVEEDLTAEFGVARTTLREALRVLESQGLLTIRRGRGGGPIVTHPDLGPISMALAASLELQRTTVGDLDEARRLIEVQIAGQLARNHRKVDLAPLDAAVQTAANAAEANDPMAFALAAVGVHEALVESAGNRTLRTLSRLLEHMVRAYYLRNTGRFDRTLMRRAIRGYRRLLDLIEAGDEVGAAAHWDATMRYTIDAHDPEETVTFVTLEEESTVATRFGR